MPRRKLLVALLAALFWAVAAGRPKRAPVVLPLKRRPLHPTGVAGTVKYGQRRLSEASTQMELYSAEWGQGVYTFEVQVGEQAQPFEVVADTGSVLFFVPCIPGCTPQTCGYHENPPYNTSDSSSFKSLSCLDLDCLTGLCSGGRCVFYDEYADGSTCQGDIVQDWVRIGDLAVQGLFGCELSSTGNIFMEGSDGIFGLGLGQASVFTQMVDAEVIDNELAVCLGSIGPEYSIAVGGNDGGGEEGNGAIVFGALATEVDSDDAVQWSPMVRSLVCWDSYLLELHNVTVDGVDISEHSDLTSAQMAQEYAEGCGAVVLDSGSTFMYMDSPALEALTAAIAAGLRGGATVEECPGVMFDTPGSNGTNITCYQSLALDIKSTGDYFPTITLGFMGADVVLQPANYLFQLGPYWPGVYVLGVYDSFGRGTVFGAIALSNQLVIFDRANGRVGFRSGFDCQTLGETGLVTQPGSPIGPFRKPLRWVMMPGGLQALILILLFIWAISACFC